MNAGKFFVVLVTAPDLKVARKLARGTLRGKLVACANLIPKIESHYWWQGKMESSAEVLILFKTTRRELAALEDFVLANHPYDTPEFVVLPITSGAERYLAWLGSSVGARSKSL
jgi:periplasmic divalent cation tolerance protein